MYLSSLWEGYYESDLKIEPVELRKIIQQVHDEIASHRQERSREKFLELHASLNSKEIEQACKTIAKRESQTSYFKTLKKYNSNPKAMVDSLLVPRNMTTEQIWEAIQIRKETILD